MPTKYQKQNQRLSIAYKLPKKITCFIMKIKPKMNKINCNNPLALNRYS